MPRATAATGATQAFLASKALVRSLRDERIGLWESLDVENRAQAALCDTDDYREGFAAFQEKREPTFTGRADPARHLGPRNVRNSGDFPIGTSTRNERIS